MITVTYNVPLAVIMIIESLLLACLLCAVWKDFDENEAKAHPSSAFGAYILYTAWIALEFYKIVKLAAEIIHWVDTSI